MKKLLLLFSSLLAVLFLTGCGGEDATTLIEDDGNFKELKAKSNKNYDLTTTDGKSMKFKVQSDVLTTQDPVLKGKYVLFNFWATWCAPCIKEMPILTKVQTDNSDKLQIVGVLMEKDKDAKELADFMNKFKMNFPVTQGEENYRMAKAFDDVKMYPESFLFGPDGKFIKKFIGEIEAEELEALLK